jgi:hypothetical protein
MSKSTKLTDTNLSQFTGTENWYRHGINRNVVFTDGAKYVADEGGGLLAPRCDRDCTALREERCRRRVPGLETEGQ